MSNERKISRWISEWWPLAGAAVLLAMMFGFLLLPAGGAR